jgi:hypothetical protein
MKSKGYNFDLFSEKGWDNNMARQNAIKGKKARACLAKESTNIIRKTKYSKIRLMYFLV